MLEYSLSPISSSSALQAAMTTISSHLRSNFNIMPSTVYLTKKRKKMDLGELHKYEKRMITHYDPNM